MTTRALFPALVVLYSVVVAYLNIVVFYYLHNKRSGKMDKKATGCLRTGEEHAN
jgi:hypothetical protein